MNSHDLEFAIEGCPHWRESIISSSEMLNDIATLMETLPRKELLHDSAFFIDFVHQSNLGEDVGTQTKAKTKELFTELLQVSQSPLLTIKAAIIETKNSFKALKYLTDIHQEMDNTGLITVQQICDLHKVLMTGLHHKAGKIRDTNVYTITPDGEKYVYPSFEEVERILYTIIDHHNDHMIQLQRADWTTYDKLVYLVKSAAWLLFNFVDAHPFSDGNGRMCRLLAGYTMMVINPFPVHPYHKTGTTSRNDFINSIVLCRRVDNRQPSRIAALLVDALDDGWRNYSNE